MTSAPSVRRAGLLFYPTQSNRYGVTFNDGRPDHLLPVVDSRTISTRLPLCANAGSSRK